MTIDAHIHVGAWDHPGFLGRRCTLAHALCELASCGVDGAAILPTDQCDNAGLLAEAHAELSAGYLGSLWMFPWVRPFADAKPGETDLKWVEANLGDITGIKIHPSLSRVRITDAQFRPALELANAQGLVVLVHCGRWQEIASYRFAIQAAQEFSNARFLLAHAGGDTPEYATNAAKLVVESGVQNVWFEFSGLREYWVIEQNVALLGAHRYLMGSDYALAHPRMYMGAVEAMDLPVADKHRILRENALEVFGTPLKGCL